MSAEKIWWRMSNEELFAAAEQISDYTEEAQQAILAEVDRRKDPEYKKEVQSSIDSQKNAAEASSMVLQRVMVADIHMPFGSMVVFMIKWALAAIPAFIILWIIGMLFVAVTGWLAWHPGLLN